MVIVVKTTYKTQVWNCLFFTVIVYVMGDTNSHFFASKTVQNIGWVTKRKRRLRKNPFKKSNETLSSKQ